MILSILILEGKVSLLSRLTWDSLLSKGWLRLIIPVERRLLLFFLPFSSDYMKNRHSFSEHSRLITSSSFTSCSWSFFCFSFGVLLSLCILLTLRGDFGFDFGIDLGADLSIDLFWLLRLLSLFFSNWVNSISCWANSCSWLWLATLGLKSVIVKGVRAILLSFSLPSLRCKALREGWKCWKGAVKLRGDIFWELCCNSCVKVNGLVCRSEQGLLLGSVGEL